MFGNQPILVELYVTDSLKKNRYIRENQFVWESTYLVELYVTDSLKRTDTLERINLFGNQPILVELYVTDSLKKNRYIRENQFVWESTYTG